MSDGAGDHDRWQVKGVKLMPVVCQSVVGLGACCDVCFDSSMVRQWTGEKVGVVF